jgi:predicted DNA-binding protein (MmcQ/YjbR family)
MATAKRRTANQVAKQLDRMRAIALALPEVTEELTWETSINFRVRNKIFLFPGGGDQVMVKAEREELPALLADPRFRPAPYLARGGWVVLDLGGPGGHDVDWDEVTELIHSSYCLIAPKRLAAQVAPGAPG